MLLSCKVDGNNNDSRLIVAYSGWLAGHSSADIFLGGEGVCTSMCGKTA